LRGLQIYAKVEALWPAASGLQLADLQSAGRWISGDLLAQLNFSRLDV
jgi:hypothetical protein